MDYSGHSPEVAIEDTLRFLELDKALLEYFDHAPFDDRIDALLSSADHIDERITFEGFSSQDILDESFQCSEYTKGERISHYFVETLATKESAYAFSISSTPRHNNHLSFVATGNGDFSVFNSKTDEIRTMSGLETTRLVWRAIDISDRVNLEELAQISGGENSVVFEEIIKKSWEKAQLQHLGSATTDHFVARPMFDDVHGKEAQLRLGYQVIETPEKSNLTFVLEKAFEHKELDAEEVYRFEATYAVTQSSSSIQSEKATRVVRGDGGLSLKSIKAIHTELGGRKTALDITDPEIMQDFIEVYEVLLQSGSK